ncbi:efflux RND transporter periplasmic adaptor subunit [Rhizobium sp. CFBP 8762]|uniref:efflux RND transporter periplasmic adaptor subunit n=1 Tax=Rhizobium sp. CFBP 8762 TaxID=2775279 RepID=UPI0017874A12|nr:efflux RND transporter periplasmic adaptor subunit [Rhizobium sp. CFBP 8762]MBD8556615.1 efflux RND transporter periplasmic adaptor subunit [Rhizobium sp. CFBP 8762]
MKINGLMSGRWLIVGLAGALLVACKPETPAAKPETLVKTEIARFVERDQTVTLTGEIVAHTQTNLAFRVGGRITERLVDVGSRVKAGQRLARLDRQEQEADVEASRATVRSAQAQVRQLQSALDRQKTLLGRGFTTRRDFDQADTALRTAEGSLNAAIAQLSTAEASLSYTDLVADADGVVTARTAEVGQVAQAGQTMFTVALDGERDAVFDLYESLFFEKYLDKPVTIALLADPAVTAQGTVSEISPTMDTASGTVRVKVAIRPTPEAMTLGSSVSGTAYFMPRRVIVLPWTALSANDGTPAVWVVDPQSKAVSLKSVTIASYETGSVLISGGLAGGETVVTDGTKFLRPNQVVSVAEPDPAYEGDKS